MNISKVACVGAGLIGEGWATLFASQGLEVMLHDTAEPVLVKALGNIASNLRLLEANQLLDPGATDRALGRIKTTLQLAEAVHQADYVQESAPEDYDLKKKVFQEMDRAAPRHAILASSASGLLMTEIQQATTRPERCVLAHPVLPVHLVPLVEIAGGQQTSSETVRTTKAFMEKLGKTPVVLNREVPGYIVNRLQAALLREAIDLVVQGVVSAEDVDRAFCMGIGLRDPFVGPLLRIYLTANGIERFFEQYGLSYHYRLETMATWTSVPTAAAEAVAKGVNEMDIVRSKTLEEITNWRDEMLIKLLKVIHEQEA